MCAWASYRSLRSAIRFSLTFGRDDNGSGGEDSKIPVSAGSRHGDVLWLIQPWLVMMQSVLFSLAAGDHDRGSAQHEHSASDVEDRGTDAAG